MIITFSEYVCHDISSHVLLPSIILSLILILVCVSVYLFKVMILFNGLLVLTSIQGGFEFPITSSLFDVFKLFVSLLLKFELTVIHILFLDLNETFLPSFLLDDLNNITNYFTSIK